MEQQQLPRPTIDLQRAHDIFGAIMVGEVEVPEFVGKRELVQRLDVLCWALGHDHNTRFAQFLSAVEEHVNEQGVQLMEGQTPLWLPRGAAELVAVADKIQAAFGGARPLDIKMKHQVGETAVDGKVAAVIGLSAILWCLGRPTTFDQFVAGLDSEINRNLTELVSPSPDADPK